MISRRIFVRNSALAMVGVGSAPLWLGRALRAAQAAPARKRVLVAIFQRGAADGLNIVVPHGDPRYYQLRPSIAVPRPGSGQDAAIDLDGFFGLHPSLAPLEPLYREGLLAIVHAAGSPDPTRSHFDAQDYMESGTPGRKATGDGWMNRALPAAAPPASPVRAVAIGPVLPRALAGPQAALAMDSLADFQVRDPAAAKAFQSAYEASGDAVLAATARETFEAVALLAAIRKQPPPSAAEYPRSRFGQGLRQIAQLIKADAGVEMAFADVGGWDHHVNEAPQLAGLLRDYGQSLAAFCRDLGGRAADVTVVTMSEFGRTARENGNRGTDHGHANCMFVMGGPVRGGKMYGPWPGLAPEQLYESRDLNLVTDFRAVLGELVARHLGGDPQAVFPGFQAEFRGLIA